MLPAAFQTIVNLPLHCNCLGVDPGTGPAYDDGEIRFSYIAPPFKLPTPYNTITVTLQSIKRLPAHDDGGSILYSPEEDIQLELYANQDMRSAVLDNMIENEERILDVGTITINRPKSNELLVLIANIRQLPYTVDSRFVILKDNTNFGNGPQTIIIQKTYWQKPFRLPNGEMSKPVQRAVDAYEIKLYVKALIPIMGIPVNIPPVARAGKDVTITLPVNSVTLDGTASSDTDGNISNYTWAKISGPSSYKFVANTAVTTVKGMVEGTYIFSLKVTDNEGATNTDTVVIKVKKLIFNINTDNSVTSRAVTKNATAPVEESKLYVYPNPGLNIINIKVEI